MYQFKSPKANKLTRHVMYQEIAKFLQTQELAGKSSLFISSAAPLDEFFASPDYIDFPEYSIEDLSPLSKRYDYVVCDQVLEHVARPWRVPQELENVLNPGGIVIMTTVFSYYVHNYPKDYWRFSIDGLKELFWGYNILSAGSWGNPRVVNYIYEHRKIGSKPLDYHNCNRNLIYNDPDYPVVTWIIAQN